MIRATRESESWSIGNIRVNKVRHSTICTNPRQHSGRGARGKLHERERMESLSSSTDDMFINIPAVFHLHFAARGHHTP